MPKLRANEEVNVMVCEWQSLREEILSRIRMHNTTISIALTAIAILAGLAEKGLASGLIFVAAPFLVLILSSIHIFTFTIISWTAGYLAALEERIAKIAGKRLLCWESRASVGRYFTGFYMSGEGKIVNPMAMNAILYVFIYFLFFVGGVVLGSRYIKEHHGLPWAVAFVSVVLVLVVLIVIGFVSIRKAQDVARAEHFKKLTS